MMKNLSFLNVLLIGSFIFSNASATEIKSPAFANIIHKPLPYKATGQYDMQYSTLSTFPTSDDFLYNRLISVSFYSATKSGQCAGNERTFDLRPYTSWENSHIVIGGPANADIADRQISAVETLNAASNLFSYIPETGQCAEVMIAYKNGSANKVGDNAVDNVVGFNDSDVPLVFSNLQVQDGKVTSATLGNHTVSFKAVGHWQFIENAQTIQNTLLTTSHSQVLTLKNIGYGQLNSLTWAPQSWFRQAFDEGTCNSSLSSEGSECSWTYNGKVAFGRSALMGYSSSAMQYNDIVPFKIESPGTAYCWGQNNFGQLGIGGKDAQYYPARVYNLSSDIIALAEGAQHACALSDQGQVWCWGNNSVGQLGQGDSGGDQTQPVTVSGFTSTVTQLTAGQDHTCALLASGGVECWGENDSGQLGDGTTINRTHPTVVSGLTAPAIEIAAGDKDTCALLNNGAVKCWGDNTLGQLGDGTTDQSSTPQQVSGLSTGVVWVTAGGAHACALLNSGGTVCWGDNTDGQLGAGSQSTYSDIPVSPYALTRGVVAISAGKSHTCALLSNATLFCWGNNASGQLGIGNTLNQATPVSVSMASPVVDLSTNADHTCALLNTGELMCWGNNDYGQVGNNTTEMATSPSSVNNFSTSGVAIGSGAHASFSCAIEHSST